VAIDAKQLMSTSCLCEAAKRLVEVMLPSGRVKPVEKAVLRTSRRVAGEKEKNFDQEGRETYLSTF
jgi:hypothetical protein